MASDGIGWHRMETIGIPLEAEGLAPDGGGWHRMAADGGGWGDRHTPAGKKFGAGWHRMAADGEIVVPL